MEFLKSVQKWRHHTAPRFEKNNFGKNLKIRPTRTKIFFSTKTFSDDVYSSVGTGFWQKFEKMKFSQFSPLQARKVGQYTRRLTCVLESNSAR